MENGHSNISYSAYKDFKHLTSNDFAESKQKIWDFIIRNFIRTHKIITDKELCEFTKIYISHYVGEKHCYTSYQIVDPCWNIGWDRKHKLYIDKKHKIVILESYINHFGPLGEITEDLLKAQEAAEAKRCGLEDKLKKRTDCWLEAYDTWLQVEKFDHKIDMGLFADKFREEYELLYHHQDNIAGYEEAVSAFDEYVEANPDFLSRFNAFRGDVISSDREAAAFMFALEALTANQ